METSKRITNNTIKKTDYFTSGTEQKNSIQHSSDVAKDIICSIIKNSDKEINFTKEEAMNISRMYEIIYRKVEILKRVSTTYIPPTPNKHTY